MRPCPHLAPACFVGISVKILVLQDYLRSGGTERQALELTAGFRQAGQDALLVTFRPGGVLPVPEAVPRVALQKSDFTWDWFAPGLRSFVRRQAPDIVLAMGRMANCHLGLLSAKRRVATFRTGKSLPFLFRRSLAKADGVVANSAEAAGTLTAQYGVPADKISVIYNGLLATEASERQPQPKAPGVRILICVAMFRPEKNQRELIEIVAQLPAEPAWELWLAGEGPAKAECEALAKSLNVSDRVKFLGLVRDPRRLYRQAAIAVHASASEALSNFLIEAQAHGLPAVAYDAQGISETFLPGRTGWVIPRGDQTAFRTQLIRLMTNPSATLAAEAAAFAKERFDPASQIESYLALFRRMVNVGS